MLSSLCTILHSSLYQKPSLKFCKQIYSIIVTCGLSQDTLLLGKLLQCLTSIPHSNILPYALLIFNSVRTPTISLWNTLIRASSTSSDPQTSLELFLRMRQQSVSPNKHTFPLLFKAFARPVNGNPLQFFAEVVKFGFVSDGFVRNALVSAFSNSGYTQYARRVFDESLEKDVVAWTAMINGYTRNGSAIEGLKCFMDMRANGVRADEMTIVNVLCAAGMLGDIWFGKGIHGFYIEAKRVRRDAYIVSALIDMYCKCGCFEDGRKVFDEATSRNVVLWSSLIAGYVRCNRFTDALLVFQVMLVENIAPNQSTLVSALTACTQIGALDQGRWIRHYMERSGVYVNSAVGTALIEMYAKCGCIHEALLVFEDLQDKNVYSWSAIINGLAMHGNALRSLEYFSSMLRNNVEPNEVTFIGVLSACAHAGLVEEGKKFFKLIRDVYHLEPKVDHYGCMIDLYGRAGHLEEAIKMIEDMPMPPTAGVLGALFGACMIHKAYELGEHIGKCLIKLQPDRSGRYALLANLYSATQKWEAAAQVRKMMKGRGVEKTPGCSWIEVNGGTHEFIAFDKAHSKSNDIYVMLEYVAFQLKQCRNEAMFDQLASTFYEG